MSPGIVAAAISPAAWAGAVTLADSTDSEVLVFCDGSFAKALQIYGEEMPPNVFAVVVPSRRYAGEIGLAIQSHGDSEDSTEAERDFAVGILRHLLETCGDARAALVKEYGPRFFSLLAISRRTYG